MRIFDTDVQKLKYQVLREVARHAYDDKLTECYLDIPKTIAPGPQATSVFPQGLLCPAALRWTSVWSSLCSLGTPGDFCSPFVLIHFQNLAWHHRLMTPESTSPDETLF